MDWTAIRREVRTVRKERKVTLRWLHEQTGIAPATVNRIERVEKYPAHKPDLATLGALMRAMGLTLSDFFLRIESLHVPALPENTLAPSARLEVEHGTRSLPAPTQPLDDINIVIARNTDAFVHLARTITGLATELRSAREQTAVARDRTPARPARSRKTG